MAKRPSRNDPPPKVRIASIAALTLLLGVGIGVTLVRVPGWLAPAAPGLSVPGAKGIVVDCDPFEHGGDEIDLSAAVTCRVVAKRAGGETVEGDLDGSLMGRYLCEDHDGGLRCRER